jgi:Na+-driven multidrug efflux pump
MNLSLIVLIVLFIFGCWYSRWGFGGFGGGLALGIGSGMLAILVVYLFGHP